MRSAGRGHTAPRRTVGGTLAQGPLRYLVKNPTSKRLSTPTGSAPARCCKQGHPASGKSCRINNINRHDGAFELVSREFYPANACRAIIKPRPTPCGVAKGTSMVDAYTRAFDCDRTSFGGIIALNQTLGRQNRRRSSTILPRSDRPERQHRTMEIFAGKRT